MYLFRLITTLLILINLSCAYAYNNASSPLVETDWLASHLNNVVVLDVRADQKSFINKPYYEKNLKSGEQTLTRVGGHIPSARLVLYKNVRGNQKIGDNTIKYMVISSDQFETLMQQAGVNQDSHIVITTNSEDAFDITMAARMYWQIKYFGHNNVSILNGGTAQWLIDGKTIETSLAKFPSGDWKAQKETKEIFASSEDVSVATNNKTTQLIDVRPLGQYLGTFKSGKAKAKGHIPTAKAFPVDLIASHTMPIKFSPASELQQLASALGINHQQALITYCNSGHMASGGWFVFHELLGNKNVKLYDGSMHQWTLENRPVVTMLME